MDYNLKVVSAYKGMTGYIHAVKSAESPDLAKLWAEYVIDPYWSEWAAGQFNEERTRREMSDPITDTDDLEKAVKALSSSNIEEMLCKAYEKISQLLPPPEANKVVCVYANTRIDAGVHGVVGTCIGDSVLIQANPLISGWEAYVPWVLAHEYNHTIWGYNYYYLKRNSSHDLLTAIITEGEADSFAKAVCPEVNPRWIRALTAEQEHEQWTALREYLFCEDNIELHSRFFFGDKKTSTPVNTGYTIGFNIVQEYLGKMPDISFSELAGMDAEDIFEVSGYDKAIQPLYKNKSSTYLGFATADITPAYNVQTVGFNREDNLSRGVLHRLYAQISVWLADGEKACLVAIDHIGFMYEDSNKLRDMIGNRLGVAREKVMLCFSHTHSSPNISLEPEYFRFLCDQVLSGADEAQNSMAPVKAAWGMTEADIGVNRRSINGVLDRRVNILKVSDAGTGKLRLLILRLTAHANVLYEDNYLISSDFIGVARELLEKKYGCSVMITQGASGNVKPRYEFTVEALNKMAAAVGDSVAACIDGIKPTSINRLSMFSQTDTYFADVPSMERAREISEEALRINHIDGTNWLKEVARLNAEGVKQQDTQTEIQYFILNDGCLCGVASEIMCELAVDVAKACKDDFIYFGGYTNGCGGYLPTADEYDQGGYEVLHSYLIYYIYHGRVMPLNRDTAEKLVKSVAERWNSIKYVAY